MSNLKLPAMFLVVALISTPTSFTQAQAPVVVENVVTRSFTDNAEALGTLRANEAVEVTVSVTEIITSIHFDDGQTVNRGDVLVRMTSEEEHALLEEAETNASEAKRQLKRIRSLVKAGTASQSVLDQRQRDYEAARARLTATKSRLRDRIVVAPFSGKVGLRNVSLGALVQPGDVITTLTDDSQMKLDFDVPSVFMPKLAPELSIEATSKAYGDKVFKGLVRSIDNQVDPVTRAITVRAILPNKDGTLKQGMLMKIELHMNPRESMAIPEEALLPVGGRHYVMVAVPKDDEYIAERREVEILGRSVGQVEIISGLEVGEQVVTHGGFKIKPGAKITLRSNNTNQSLVTQ